jgi:YARHG domain
VSCRISVLPDGRRTHAVELGLLLCLLGGRRVTAQALDPAWERFDFARSRVDSTAIATLSLGQLRRLRAVVFGRHGRPFADEPELHRFLQSRPWYHADAKFRNSRLSAIENANLDVIRLGEADKHPQIETGDMRYRRGRVITTAMLGHHTYGDWQVIASEVEAVHGKVFLPEDEPDTTDADGNDVSYLQLYFTERYWYHADTTYTPARLSAIERANLDTIALARMRDLGLSVAPGMMYLFQDKLLSDTMLAHVRLYDLRILRNEVFARHGRRFQTPWLAEYFAEQPWYKPNPAFRESDISEVEKANLKLIAAVEARRHEALSTREVTPIELEGLFPEFSRRLRNEIFARHGRVFRDKKLQSYFASFDWYKPDPNFDERTLTPIEKANVQVILGHEHRASHGLRFNPG